MFTDAHNGDCGPPLSAKRSAAAAEGGVLKATCAGNAGCVLLLPAKSAFRMAKRAKAGHSRRLVEGLPGGNQLALHSAERSSEPPRGRSQWIAIADASRPKHPAFDGLFGYVGSDEIPRHLVQMMFERPPASILREKCSKAPALVAIVKADKFALE